jgi:hypothetical protein
MAGLKCKVSTAAAIALVSATAKTALQLKAAANQRAVVKGFAVGGAMAAGGTDAAVKCRWTRSTANFGTGTAQTPQKLNPSDPETVQTAGASNFTVEPTSPTDAEDWFYVNPETGLTVFFPPDAYIEIPGGASLQLEMTSVSGTPNMWATLFFEE